jgi:hypothetical protein
VRPRATRHDDSLGWWRTAHPPQLRWVRHPRLWNWQPPPPQGWREHRSSDRLGGHGVHPPARPHKRDPFGRRSSRNSCGSREHHGGGGAAVSFPLRTLASRN